MSRRFQFSMGSRAGAPAVVGRKNLGESMITRKSANSVSGDVGHRFTATRAPIPKSRDGALFAFVCQVGTDPEVFLVLEARKTDEGPRWHSALARFSHLDTFAEYDGKNVWKSVRGLDDTNWHNADSTYFLFAEPAPK
ncbi:MAG TPA: hypothetical protein VFI31_27645 [Pirellulales bacterium]|nr:hypothetical protein [Pirellulales bacterium]